MLIGYARVSTVEQNLDLQIDALKSAGCTVIYEERMSGTSTARPELTRLLREIKPGDTLVFWKLDRLGRSAQHLLAIAHRLRDAGVHLRCLTAPFDTTTSAGTLMFQLLGAFAEFEANLISERTKAGMAVARGRGKIPGNPALRRGDAKALKRNKEMQDRRYFQKINSTAHIWLPVVLRMRPDRPWGDVVRSVNAAMTTEEGRGCWTVGRLVHAVKQFAADGLAPVGLLERAAPAPLNENVVTLVAAIKMSRPDITLQQLGTHLDALGQRPPRGGKKWRRSSVHLLLSRAREIGLVSEIA